MTGHNDSDASGSGARTNKKETIASAEEMRKLARRALRRPRASTKVGAPSGEGALQERKCNFDIIG